MNIELGEVQMKFAEMIWAHEPISSGELVKLAENELKWKKSTTYTVLRVLCEKGLFQNKGGQVTSLLTLKEFNSARCQKVIQESFEGSLPAFMAAFASTKPITRKEAEEIRSIIDDYLK